MNRLDSVTQPLMWAVVLMIAAVAGGCGGQGADPILGGSGQIDNQTSVLAGTIVPGATCTVSGPTIPEVTTSNPTNGNQLVTTSTTGVAGSGKLITADFSLAMNPATTTPAFTLSETSSGSSVPGTVTMNGANTKATLTTNAALTPNTSYTAIITQAATSNATSTPLGCAYAWRFKTATPAATGVAQTDLGLAAPFAIAASAGVINTGATTINGDTVLDPTATCNADPIDAAGGFGACALSPPTINGIVISPLFPDPGATSGAIKSDLLAAYNSLSPASMPGATVLGCGTIGSGGGGGAGIGCAGNFVLPPGVYISATSSTIGVTGTLTLDGQGDTNSQFVFQAPSALTTAAGGTQAAPASQIILINGAKSSNVWWWVGSSATIGTNSIFQGNVLADTSITMETNSTSCGRLLAGAVTASGAFTFDSNVVSVPGNTSAPATCQ